VKCYIIPAPKGIESLTLVDRPDPTPGPRQVLVRVRATSLNYRDLLTIEAQYARSAPKPDLIPLSDGAGEVVAVGPGVSRVKVGDRVAGCFMQKWVGGNIDDAAMASAMGGAIDGMLTELAVLEEDGVVTLPAGMSFEEGATLPCAGLTAWHALVEIGNLKAGDIVQIQGTGGVSIFALQFARMFGARVIGTSSSVAKAERLKKMGAEAVIDYKTTPDWDKETLKLTGGHRRGRRRRHASPLLPGDTARRQDRRHRPAFGHGNPRSHADPAPEPARAGSLCRQQADVRGDEPCHRGQWSQARHRQGVSLR